MKNYKETLNLPKTKFSMRGNLPIKEKEILKEWNKKKIYKFILNKKKNKKKFIIHDGPPYANGKIHIGHALNKILKDIVIKFKNLSGYQVPFTPCWDCHGLPIEHNIEKKYQENFKKLTKKEIRKKCKKYAYKQVLNQKKDFIRLGIFADWNNVSLTMDYNNQTNIIKNFYKIFKKNFIYQGIKPIHWCIQCQSSLAEAEVEHIKKKSNSLYFQLKSCNKKKIFKKFKIDNYKKYKNKEIYVVIWTTTPWTLPASQAISINPKFIYDLIETKKKILIISKNTSKKILNIINEKKKSIIKSIQGLKFEKLLFYHSFLKKKLPIILSNHVTLEMGSGIVHTAPSHGEEDYLACKKYKISPKNFIDSFGNYKKKIHEKLYKKNIFESHLIIFSLLKKNKNYLKNSIIKHSYPHCWRHKIPLIFRSTKQWFIKIDKKNFKKKIIKIIKKVSWIPNWTKNNISSLIKKRPDWCISRQRSWGIPIPLFIHKKTGKIHKNTKKFIKKIIYLIKKNGTEIWWKIKKKEFLGKKYNLYNKLKNILDVWFESGCLHTSSTYPYINKKKIADLCIEGSDQHRGWFMSSLIISSIIQKKAPYKKVITHGFTIDKNGKKMSKSIGNTISPNKIIKKYGADVLRLWVASSNYSKDIIISQEILKQISDSYRKIRNTARFLLGNIYDFNPKKDLLKQKDMLEIDVWAILKTFKTQKKIIKFYKKYKFHKVIKSILKFCFIDMSAIYLDIIKDRLYTSHKKSRNRRSCQTTIFLIIKMLTIWISPLIPFTSYEIWKNIPINKKKELFIQKWPKKLDFNILKNKIQNKTWKILFKIKNEINKIIEKKKKKEKIDNTLKTSITLYLKKNLLKNFIILKKELKFIFLTSDCFIKNYYLASKNIKENKEISGLKIKIKIHKGKKCIRCWNYYKNNKKENESKKICNRCLLNINGKEKNRIFA
ncbi:MAG: isoleucine--tRNA ligase [Buchnera aphidicola (Periphyllus lyropictus)]|uniref:isoleucine--tRNA ligase n=1 Tax=Buchnera aphidicola TaxID=9 RepID=UPI001EC1697E|nr:isoleucine--tRNA ligase [Buchnera aphidicola]NIH16695.1 isoleucine--tRNA ligase [Buchnera aphidicola (Periphyllus lyropictus)]USS94602.1 isoleucine--tRNA ligase [Buchnera aphidicola (Periphyllus lyropictus)]